MKIESKVFSCGFHRNFKGRVVRITEDHRRRRFYLSAEEVVIVWIFDAIDDLLLAPSTQKFFCKTDCKNDFIWIQKITNKRGSFLEITKVANSGGKNNLVVPTGIDFKGWLAFANLLKDFVVGKVLKEKEKQPNNQKFRKKSYAEIIIPK